MRGYGAGSYLTVRRALDNLLPYSQIPIMSIRKKPIDEALFGRIRRELLSIFLLNPGSTFYLLELVHILRTGRGGVQRELDNLVRAGIVTRKRKGVKVLFSIAEECPLRLELKELILSMAAPEAAFSEILSGYAAHVRAAVMIDAGFQSPSEEVKLLIVSDGLPEDLTTELDRVQLLTGVTLDLTVAGAAEARRLVSSDRNYDWVLSPSAYFLVGSEEDLTASGEAESDEGPDLFSSAGLNW